MEGVVMEGVNYFAIINVLLFLFFIRTFPPIPDPTIIKEKKIMIRNQNHILCVSEKQWEYGEALERI